MSFNSPKQGDLCHIEGVHYDSSIIEGMHGVLWPTQQQCAWTLSESWGIQKDKHKIKIDRKYTNQMFYLLWGEFQRLSQFEPWVVEGGKVIWIILG